MLSSTRPVVRELFQDTNNEITLNAAADLLTRASLQAGDPCLGLHWAESYPEGAAGVIGFLAMNAKSLRAALKVLSRYMSLYVDPVEFTFMEAEGVGNLTWRFSPSFTVPRMQYDSFAMALLIIRLRRVRRCDLEPDGRGDGTPGARLPR